jgi:O-antigen/teichoic acid export membrane protein
MGQNDLRARLAPLLRRLTSFKELRGLLAAAIWQVSNYLVPLLVLPYLGRMLGVAGFGAVGIGMAVSAYAVLITDWGFTYTATQAAAQDRDDHEVLNRLIWSTICAKALLGLVAAISIFAGTLLFVTDSSLRLVLPISAVAVFGSIFNVDWALRGIERLGLFAATSVIGRLSSVPVALLLVHGESDVAAGAFALMISGPITAALTLVVAHRAGILRAPSVSWRTTLTQIGEGTHIFLSTAIIGLYTNGLILILGAMSTAAQVGLFSVADKIRRPVQSLYAPITMVYFSRLNFLIKSDPPAAKVLARKIMVVQGALTAVLAVALAAVAPVVIGLLFGSGFEAAVPVLRVLAALVVLVGLSNVFGVMIMIPFGLKREFTACITLGAVVGMGLVFPLAHYWGAFGTAIAAAVAETCVTVAMFVVLARRHRWILGGTPEDAN